MKWFDRVALLPCLLLAGCGLKPESHLVSPYILATWTENRVSGEIRLTWEDSGRAQLETIFTPEDGCHLYSKDIPREGVEGLGRPTLLEVIPGTTFAAAGELFASLDAIQDADIPGLLVYPEGSVTLTLPVTLPEGAGWYDEQVSVTYMACKDGRCYPPVETKIIPVRLPGWEEIRGQ